MKDKFSIFAILAIAAIAVCACSTKRDKWINRTWHGINTKYNGWWNGNEALKEGVRTLNKNHKDDFNYVLPIFKYGTKENAGAVTPNMDRAIEKAVSMIKLHSMLINGKQRNKYIDDCYFLVGKANYYKYEIYQSVQQFRYVMFSSENKNTKHLAQIWMIKAYNRQKEFAQARTEIINLKNKSLSPANKFEFNKVVAEYYLMQNDYASAIEPLIFIINNAKKKAEKARYTFILAQVYQILGEEDKAIKRFEEVVKLKPEYELEFQAALHLARLLGGKEGGVNLEALLKKMLKDEKNLEFQDQIYYALAVIAENKENEELAIKNYNLSIRSSVNNNTQKALSYLALAEYNFAKPDYVKAQGYYDSTATNLPETHPKFEEVNNFKNSLSDVVFHINNIVEKDSLLRLSSLPEEQLIKKIEKHIEFLKKEDQRKKEEEERKAQMDALALQTQSANPFEIDNSAGGKWYFYNQAVVSQGINEFKRIWGNRKLEDNWRRRNKASAVVFFQEDGLDTLSEVAKMEIRYSVDTYLEKIPRTPEDKKAARESMYESYYKLALIYKDRLKNYKEAIKTLEDLIKRGTDHQYIPVVYYQLYLIFKELNDNLGMEKYKGIIISSHPDSEYAKILSDPDYLAKKEKEENKAEETYQTLYKMFKEKRYPDVIADADVALQTFKGHILLPRFALLKAISLGELGRIEEYKAALKYVSTTYEDEEIKAEANRRLSIFEENKKEETTQGKDDGGGVKTEYTVNNRENHFFVLVIPSSDYDMNALKATFSDFNTKYYKNEPLTVKATMLDKENQLIIVDGLKGKDKSISYLKNLVNNTQIIDNITTTLDPTSFVITQSNFGLLMRSKNLSQYLRFFHDNYSLK